MAMLASIDYQDQDIPLHLRSQPQVPVDRTVQVLVMVMLSEISGCILPCLDLAVGVGNDLCKPEACVALRVLCPLPDLDVLAPDFIPAPPEYPYGRW